MLLRNTAKARARGGAARSQTVDFPLPLAGFDARARSGNMPASLAGVLENLRPNGPKIQLRPPIERLTQPDAGVLQRIPLEFARTAAMVEVRDNSLFDGTTSIFTSSGHSGRALHASISSNLIIADEFAGLSRFDGYDFHGNDFTSNDVKVSDLDGVIAHHDRVFAWDTGAAPDFYYGGVGAVMGALTRFPLSRLGNVTGRILAMLSLSRDGGAGPQNSLAIFTSSGQVIVYQGFNPGDPANWSLTGRYQTVAPRARLGFCQVGGDVWVLTMNGIVPLSVAIGGSIEAMTSPLSDPILDDLKPLLERPEGSWHLMASPEGDFVILNRHDGSSARQWIFDTRAKAWFTSSMPIRSMHTNDGRLRFTMLDGSEAGFLAAGGTERIAGVWHSGWIDVPRRFTRLDALEPLLLVDGQATVTLTVRSDDGQVIPKQIAKVGQGGQVGQTIRYNFACGVSAHRVRLELSIEGTRAELLGLQATVQ